MRKLLLAAFVALVIFTIASPCAWASKSDSTGKSSSRAKIQKTKSNSHHGTVAGKAPIKSHKVQMSSNNGKKSFFEEEKSRKDDKKKDKKKDDSKDEKSGEEKAPVKPAEKTPPVSSDESTPAKDEKPAEDTTPDDSSKSAEKEPPAVSAADKTVEPSVTDEEEAPAPQNDEQVSVKDKEEKSGSEPAVEVKAPAPATSEKDKGQFDLNPEKAAEPKVSADPAEEKTSGELNRSPLDKSPEELMEQKKPGTEEGPTKVTAVEIVGNKHIATEEILSVIRTRVGEPLLEPRIRSDLQAIFETGYFTDIKWDTSPYAGGVKVIFRVQENPVINKITLIGNKIVPTNKILELIQTKEGKILNMKTLNIDMAEINYYYDESLGYELKPTHVKDVNFTSDGELILSIQEGMVVKEVEVTGSTVFSDEKLRSLVTLKKGDLLNTKQLKTDTTAIAKYYEEEGYILDTARPQINYKDGLVSIQIIEAVAQAIKVIIEPIKGRTKVKTKDVVVYRNIRTQVGEVLQQKKIKKDIERLKKLGLFSDVDMEPEPGNKPGNVILVFKMREQKTGMASLGVGYTGGGSGSLRTGITGAVSFSEKNIGGTGQGASISWQRGVNVDAITVGYSNPAINRNQDSIGVNIFRQNYMELKQPLNNDSSSSEYALYDDKRIGGSIVYGRRITDDLRLFLSLRHENLKISRNANSDYEPVGISEGTLNSMGVGAFYDTRNDVFDPTEGWYVDANVIMSGHMLKGSYDYWKYQAELRKYIPIGKKKKSAIALRAWGGIVKGDDDEIPITETFYVGGTDTIRGYAQNEFFGTRMVVLNAEYRFPLGNIKFLKGVVFADAGNAWFPDDDRKKLYADGGVGLRIVFPTLGLGVIRLDYASGEGGGRTSIGIGQTF